MKQMKKTQILLIFLFLFSFAYPVLGQPKYTTKENAIKLALLLDKGAFGALSISSTYVLNTSTQDYYISAILSDGTSHKWFINQIYQWVKEGRIQLSGNRSLIFLSPKTGHFEILEKNEFHKLALRSKIYIKTFGHSDPLEGQQFYYRIKSFNLISPDEKAFGRDNEGFEYKYLIDLANGTREPITYNDAFLLMKHKRLLTEMPENVPVLDKAYHITQIVPHGKMEGENGISQFGVEIIFDRPFKLNRENFGVELYESTYLDRKINKKKQDFLLDLTIPNSEKKFEIKPIPHLEYLQDIKVVKDFRYPKRLLLRAKFNPNVMDIPPVVTKIGDRELLLSFFHLVDQTVYSRNMLLEEEKRKAREWSSKRVFKVSTKLNRDTQYGKSFITAVDALSLAQKTEDVENRIQKYIEAIERFELAAIEAQNDKQLMEALRQRNTARDDVIHLSIEFVKQSIKDDSKEKSTLITALNRIESLTIDPKIIAEIEELRNILSQD